MKNDHEKRFLIILAKGLLLLFILALVMSVFIGLSLSNPIKFTVENKTATKGN